MKKRFYVMLGGIFLVCAGWVVGWQYLSGKADDVFTRVTQQINQGDQEFSCVNQRTGGFPFRLSISCDETVFEQGETLKIQLAGVQAQAFAYRPSHQVADFTSPARINVGRFGQIELQWEQARIGSQLQTNGLRAATAKVKNARAALVNAPPELAGVAVKADSVLVSARRTGGDEPADSVVFGTIAEGLAVLGEKYKLPPFGASASVLAYDVAPAFSGKARPFPLWIEKGGEADIQHFNLVSGHAELLAKGWVKLDQRGFVNADLDVDSVNLISYVDQMGSEFVQIQAIARAVIGAMEGMGSPVDLKGKKAKRVKISIRNGFVKIGIIPLGHIPQVDLSRIR